MAIVDDAAWIIDIHKPDTTSLSDFVIGGKFKCAEAQMASTDFNGAWGFSNYSQTFLPPAVLTAMMLASLVAILIILKRRDPI
jgi:hypothetical protein